MRSALIRHAVVLPMFVLLVGTTVGQESPPAPQAIPPRQFYLNVTIIELSEGSKSATEKLLQSENLFEQIDDLEREGIVTSRRHIVTSIMERVASTVQFGGREPIVTGVTMTGRGQMEQISYENVGTMLQVSMERVDDDEVAMQLEFESSEIEHFDEDKPLPKHRVATFTIRSTMHLTLGVPRIIAGEGSDAGSLLIVTVK